MNMMPARKDLFIERINSISSLRTRAYIDFLCVALFLTCGVCRGQSHRAVNKLWADSVVADLIAKPGTDNDRALALADSAYNFYHAQQDKCGMLQARMLSGKYFDGLGKADSAIARLLWARENFSAPCDSAILFRIYLNLSSAYLTMNDLNAVDEVCSQALAGWNRQWKQHATRFGLLNNKAIAQATVGNMDQAQQTFRLIYSEARMVGDTANMNDALINLGTIKFMIPDADSAYYYYNLALESIQKGNDYYALASVKFNIAVVLGNSKRYTEAFALLDEIETIALEHSDLKIRADVEKSRANLYMDKGDYAASSRHFIRYIELHEEALNEERIRSVADMQEKYETEKKKREIQDLKVKNLDAELLAEKAKRARNRMYGGAGMLAIGFFFLVQRYRTVRKNRNQLREKNIIIEAEKQRSDDLLRNILPDEVAEELKQYGKAKAQHFDTVSILFTDFKGFTMISEKLSAGELVAELDACFQAFDHIVTQYGLEKIKTIGDAYMAAGGLPLNHPHDAQKVIEAALDMQQFMTARKQERNAAGLPAFEMRVGIHTGPVVAGIVGIKKFAYDIWGDTVNTASRMESSGEVGEVNISEATWQLVQHAPQLQFTERGKISAKNKGEMTMYFVRRK
jgi:class 3 adenylate cyclase